MSDVTSLTAQGARTLSYEEAVVQIRQIMERGSTSEESTTEKIFNLLLQPSTVCSRRTLELIVNAMFIAFGNIDAECALNRWGEVDFSVMSLLQRIGIRFDTALIDDCDFDHAQYHGRIRATVTEYGCVTCHVLPHGYPSTLAPLCFLGPDD